MGCRSLGEKCITSLSQAAVDQLRALTKVRCVRYCLFLHLRPSSRVQSLFLASLACLRLLPTGAFLCSCRVVYEDQVPVLPPAVVNRLEAMGVVVELLKIKSAA